MNSPSPLPSPSSSLQLPSLFSIPPNPKPNSPTKTLIPFHQPQPKFTQTLAKQFKHGQIQTLTHFNHLFMRMVLAEELDLAQKFYSTLPTHNLSPNSFTFSILVNCHCKRNDPIEAKRVLHHMIVNNIHPPEVKTFTRVINSFCKKGQITHAYEVFDMMRKVNCEPTINTYNCLLKGLCYVGRIEDAYQQLVKIKEDFRLKPDVYTYTAVMDGFCKVGRSDEGLELLNEAIEMGLEPSVVCYNTIFNGYFKEGRPLEGFGLLEQMKERNCKPDCVTYSTLLHGLLQWGEIKASIRVYNEMLDSGFEVDERMMNTLLRGVCRKSRKEKELLKDAYQVFDEMSKRGCDVDSCGYELIIEAFCNGNEMDRAFTILCEIMRLGLCPATFTLGIVVRGLCAEGKIEKAMWILALVCRGRNEMIERGTFDVLINAMNRRGMVASASCVYCVALKNGVMPLRKPRR